MIFYVDNMLESEFKLRTNISEAESKPAMNLGKLSLFGSNDWEEMLEDTEQETRRKKVGPELLEEAKVENMGESV